MRYLMLVPIFFVLASLVYMIVLMGMRFWHAVELFDTVKENPFEVLSHLIDVIDFSLLCVIALIIVWWLYEIFLNRISIHSRDQLQADQVLIHDIDELKQKLGKVIVISLVVHVFKQMILFVVHDSIDLLVMGGVVLLLALGLYFVEKLWSHGSGFPRAAEPEKT
jgi:uncharacterized membrane protein YqhA